MNGEPDSGRPSWMPPDDVLPAVVPVGQFLIRARRVIVALSHVSVYPAGCMLDVRASARGHEAVPDVFENVVFAARFGAGTMVVMHDKTAPRWLRDGTPALRLMQYGLEGSFPAGSDDDRRADCTIKLWLCPLPPSELGTLSLVSPSFGPGPASCPLDGRVIVAAATQVQPYWA